MKNNNFIIILFFVSLMVQAQKIERVEPPNWWVGMKNNQIELMIYGDDISEYTPSIDNSTISLKTFILAFVPFFLGYGFGQAFTDSSQTDTDSISSPYRPVIQGLIKKSDLKRLNIVKNLLKRG